MERFYEIGVDYDIEDRWYLDQPTVTDGTELVTGRMSKGEPWDLNQKLFSRLYSCGRSVSFSRGGLGAYFVAADLMDVLRSTLPAENLQGIPVEIDGVNESFEILNVLDIVDCLDEERSGLSWRTDADGKRSYAVNKLKIDPLRARGHDLFRVKTWRVALVCSERIRDLLVANGVTGIRFTLVS